ncbi:MAG: sulfatase [Acidobacteria bacterium]|nr:sulfatase [Acidobacteriota bacterium]
MRTSIREIRTRGSKRKCGLNDWVEGFGGHPQTVTPNLHKLAQRSIRFQNAYCQAPMCNPSRASLLTGLRPTTTGVYENDHTWRDGAPTAVTLPEYFRNNGYRVEAAGKIYHSKQTDFGAFHAYGKEQDSEGGAGTKKDKFDFGPVDDPAGHMPDYQTASYGVQFLAREHKQPFFLACGMIKPHLAWNVPKKHFDKFAAMDVKLPPYLPNDLDDVPASAIRAQARKTHKQIAAGNRWQAAVAAYLACINYADEQLGRVLDALNASPYRDNTIVVLFGDHGWHLGEKDHWQKFTLWERSCRAPLLIHVPGGKSGDCRRVVEFLDLYPTLVDLCGLPPKQGLEGVSLRPLLDNPKAAWTRAAITSNGAEKITIRTERWRYTKYSDGEELYDETADPNEWTNLASKPGHGAVKASLAALLPREVNTRVPRSWDALPLAEKQRLRRTAQRNRG